LETIDKRVKNQSHHFQLSGRMTKYGRMFYVLRAGSECSLYMAICVGEKDRPKCFIHCQHAAHKTFCHISSFFQKAGNDVIGFSHVCR
jgi:hypothetical protein